MSKYRTEIDKAVCIHAFCGICARAGDFTVRLTVTDNDGAQNTATKTVTVFNIAPTADFSYFPTTPKVDEDIQFTDESTDPEGEIVSCFWDFGDDNTSTAENPVHRYEEAGTYTVKLTVTDDEGVTDTITQTVHVKESLLTGGVELWIIAVVVAVAATIIAGIGFIFVRRRRAAR